MMRKTPRRPQSHQWIGQYWVQ
jgi:hypothetical protein